MRVAATVVFALMILCVYGIGASNAQTPYFGVFFETDGWGNYSTMQKDTPPGGGLDLFYVVATDLNVLALGFEYSLIWPGSITYAGETAAGDVVLGTSVSGISIAFNLPQNGFQQILLSTVNFVWNAGDCAVLDDPIHVIQNPNTGFIGYTVWPSFDAFPAQGLTSLLCATIPTEETTWGKVKSLYSE
jgi:hypothetical protein